MTITSEQQVAAELVRLGTATPPAATAITTLRRVNGPARVNSPQPAVEPPPARNSDNTLHEFRSPLVFPLLEPR